MSSLSSRPKLELEPGESWRDLVSRLSWENYKVVRDFDYQVIDGIPERRAAYLALTAYGIKVSA